MIYHQCCKCQNCQKICTCLHIQIGMYKFWWGPAHRLSDKFQHIGCLSNTGATHLHKVQFHRFRYSGWDLIGCTWHLIMHKHTQACSCCSRRRSRCCHRRTVRFHSGARRRRLQYAVGRSTRKLGSYLGLCTTVGLCKDWIGKTDQSDRVHCYCSCHKRTACLIFEV
jgi:hypothetical protein